MRSPFVLACIVLVTGCGSDSGGYSVAIGPTTLVVTVNPVINDATSTFVTDVGDVREQGLSLDTGSFVTSDGDGIAIFSPVTAGVRTLVFPDETFIQFELREGDVRDLVVAYDVASASMAASNITLRQAIRINPGMSEAAINDILDGTNELVIASDGKYAGNIDLAGSNITLIGEDGFSDAAAFEADFAVTGSFNRIRGLGFRAGLSVEGSGNFVGFSTVDGALSVTGQEALLLGNRVCAVGAITGGTLKAFDNQGMAPLDPPDGC